MQSIVINRSDLYHDNYHLLGSGGEGEVYKYSDTIAFKIFNDLMLKTKKLDEINKIRLAKIKELMKLEDANFCFPKGFVKDQDDKIIGYYMELVKKMTIYDLNFSSELKDKLAYFIAASISIERIHKKGIALGDIRESNMLMNDKKEIKFIDTDNFAYQEYPFSLKDVRTNWLYDLYQKEFSLIDNDKYVLTILALNSLCGNILYDRQNPTFFKNFIAALNVSEYVKAGLGRILSDKPNKPYIGEFLQEINPDAEILSLKDKKKLCRVRYK